jgi:hypothetical protein
VLAAWLDIAFTNAFFENPIRSPPPSAFVEFEERAACIYKTKNATQFNSPSQSMHKAQTRNDFSDRSVIGPFRLIPILMCANSTPQCATFLAARSIGVRGSGGFPFQNPLHSTHNAQTQNHFPLCVLAPFLASLRALLPLEPLPLEWRSPSWAMETRAAKFLRLLLNLAPDCV